MGENARVKDSDCQTSVSVETLSISESELEWMYVAEVTQLAILYLSSPSGIITGIMLGHRGGV